MMPVMKPVTPEEAFREGNELFQKRVSECVERFNDDLIEKCSRVREGEDVTVHFSGGPDMDALDPNVLKKVVALFEKAGWAVDRTDGEYWLFSSDSGGEFDEDLDS